MVMLAACAPAGGGAPVTPSAPGTPAAEFNSAGLSAGLRADGYQIASGGSLTQPFLAMPDGTVLNLSTSAMPQPAQLQVFEYGSASAARADVQHFSTDGSTFSSTNGATMVEWVAAPHIHQRGRVLAIYVGTDGHLLAEFDKQLGKQFAGQ